MRPTSHPIGSFPDARERRRSRLRRPVLWGLLGCALPLALGAQDTRAPSAADSDAGAPARACPLGRVGRIEVRNHSLFAPEDVEGRRFEWALRLANWAHVRTRSDYLRGELLFSEGDCWNPESLDESVRWLRAKSFIARVEGTPTMEADSTWVVRIETWDEWTTQLSILADVQDRIQFKGVSLAEQNLAGIGLRAAASYRKFREQDDRSLAIEARSLFATRMGAEVSVGRTREGVSLSAQVTRPFVGEVGRGSFAVRAWHQDFWYSFIAAGPGDVTNVVLPLEEKGGQFRLARRWGRPGSLFTLGGDFSAIRRTVSGPLRQVIAGDFEGALPLPDSVAPTLGSGAVPQSWVRVALTTGIRRVSFTSRRGLELVSGVQDVATGSEWTVTLGRTVGTWGTAPLDYYAILTGFLAGASGPLAGRLAFEADGRRVDRVEPGAPRLRGMGLAGHAKGYYQSGGALSQTLEAGLRVAARWRTDFNYQTVLGGMEGVRSYRDDELPAGAVLVGRVEERINFPWLRPAVDLGVTVFGDLGAGWANGVPFAVDTGWRGAVGAGLRLGFPAGTSSNTRVELAWPVGGPAGRGPVFRVYLNPTSTSR